jgi:hypothetical protein
MGMPQAHFFDYPQVGHSVPYASSEEAFMQIHEMARSWFSAPLDALSRGIDRKTTGILATLVVLILFGDTLLSLLGHGLHILIEVVESALEHFLESSLGLTPRQAQIGIAWTGLGFAIWLSWRLSRKAYFAALRALSAARLRWCALKDSATAARSRVTWIRVAVMVGAMGTTLYLFT